MKIGIVIWASLLLSGCYVDWWWEQTPTGYPKERLNYTIVPAKSPRNMNDFAAEQLAEFLSKAYQKPILANQSDDDIMFFVGYGPKAAAIWETEPKFTEGQFGVFIQGRNVLLAGQDDYVGPLSLYGHTGTLLSVYYFLQKYAGVRFFFPGPHGTQLKLDAPLALVDGPDVPGPTFSVRSFSRKTPAFSDKENDLYWKRMLCALPNWCYRENRTSFANWKKRFWETHPEYFVEDKNGKKQFHPWKWSNPNFMHPGVIKQTAEDLKDIFRKDPLRPAIHLFSDIPYRPGFSELAQNSPERRLSVDGDYSQEYYTFAAKVVDLVLKEFPDKYFIVHTKGNYKFPPKPWPLSKRVAVEILDRSRTDMTGKSDEASMGLMQAWQEEGHRHYLKSYVRPTQHMPFPMFAHHHLKDYTMRVAGKTEGYVISDLHPRSPFSFSLFNNYVQAKLLFNKDEDVDKLLADFCAFAFPGAKTEMIIFYNTMEKLWTSRTERRKDPYTTAYTLAKLSEPKRVLDAAKIKVQPGSFLFEALYADFDAFYEKARQKNKLYKALAPKKIVVTKTQTPPSLDGDLAEWEGVKAYPLHFVSSRTGGQFLQKTNARFQRTEDRLFMALTAYEKDRAKMLARCRKNGEGDPWGDDGFSLYIQAVDGPVHVGINHLGFYRVVRGKKDIQGFGLQTAAKTYDDRYVIELSIPLAQLAGASSGKPVGCNLVRHRMCIPADYQFADLRKTKTGALSFTGVPVSHQDSWSTLVLD